MKKTLLIFYILIGFIYISIRLAYHWLFNRKEFYKIKYYLNKL